MHHNNLSNSIVYCFIYNSVPYPLKGYNDDASNKGGPPLGRIEVPTGIALFQADVLLPPKEWIQRNLNVTHWTAIPRGGHFTAMEEPRLLADDLRAFYRPLRTELE